MQSLEIKNGNLVIAVIAQTRGQFFGYIEAKKADAKHSEISAYNVILDGVRYVYIGNATHLLSIKFNQVVLVGRYYERNDWDEIAFIVKYKSDVFGIPVTHAKDAGNG